MRRINQKGLDLIKRFESLHDGDLTKIGLQPKECPAGIWTVGYGRALKDEKGEWLRGEEGKKKAYEIYPALTEEEAVKMLLEDTQDYADRVSSLKLDYLNPNQFSALVSFAYNVGFANLKSSTLLKKIMEDTYSPEIPHQFSVWNKARVNGKLTPLRGLTRRRKAESDLYFDPEL